MTIPVFPAHRACLAALAAPLALPLPAPSGAAAAQAAPAPAIGAPTISIAFPAPGVPLPADRPVVVLRFAPSLAAGDGDRIDGASLRVWVDGIDRTAAFQVTAGEAWGSLGTVADCTAPAGHPSVRRLEARICSVRGVCGSVAAWVLVGAPAERPRRPDGDGPSRVRQLLDLLLVAARRLLGVGVRQR